MLLDGAVVKEVQRGAPHAVSLLGSNVSGILTFSPPAPEKLYLNKNEWSAAPEFL